MDLIFVISLFAIAHKIWVLQKENSDVDTFSSL